MDADLYRIEEAAQVLRIGRSKAYELIRSGELPVVRIGRAVRVPRAALEKWVAAQTAPWVDIAV
jgi:excisionase family DNA binding protein